MLDLGHSLRKQTQGQPAGSMQLRRQRTPDTASEAAAEESAPAEQTSPEATIDTQLLAARVYERLRQELVVERERYGRRR